MFDSSVSHISCRVLASNLYMLGLTLASVRPRLASFSHHPVSRSRPSRNSARYTLTLLCNRPRRRTFTTDTQEAENLNVSHSRFLAEKSRTAKWKKDDEDWGGETDLKESEDFDNLAAGKGMSFHSCQLVFSLLYPLRKARYLIAV